MSGILTKEAQEEIKQLWKSGKYTQKEIAKIFKVLQPVISEIVSGDQS